MTTRVYCMYGLGGALWSYGIENVLARAIRKKYEDEVESVQTRRLEDLARARFAVYGTSIYPDATFSLRVTYGTVRGYKEGSTELSPITLLGGAFDRHTGREPFVLPPSWLAAKGRLKASTPLNFVSTLDIIGGNSGSPVLNRDAPEAAFLELAPAEAMTLVTRAGLFPSRCLPSPNEAEINIPAFPQSAAITQGGFGAQVLALTGDPDGPRQYDDPEFDPFWKACVDHDLAVTIHLGARSARPGQFKFLPNMVMSKLCMAEPISILVFGGVFDRFPDLRYGAIESGAGWLAFVAEYMDNIYDSQRHWLKLDLQMKPSEYFDRNIYASFIRDPVGIRNRNLKGGRNIMWSTDYPHSETTWPESRKLMDWQFEGVSEEEIRPIVRDNARRFYGLG